jgi:hypothetical protein
MLDAITNSGVGPRFAKIAPPMRYWLISEEQLRLGADAAPLADQQRSGRTRISDAASGNSGSCTGAGQLDVGRAGLGMISRKLYHKPQPCSAETTDSRAKPAVAVTLLFIVYHQSFGGSRR